MCSEGILTLKELFTASLDGYIYYRAYLVSGRQVQTWSFFCLVPFAQKKRKKGIMNRKDRSSSVF